MLSFLAGIGLGGALVSLGHTKPGDSIYPFVIYRLVVTIMLITYSLIRRKPLLPPGFAVGPLVAAAFCSSVGDVCVLWALQHDSYRLKSAPCVWALRASF